MRRMEKHIILGADGTFLVIAHACPNAIGKFQWYLVDEPNSEKEYFLNGQIYESITISSTYISKKCQNKWLCCKCEIGDDKYIEGCVYLSDDFCKMINTNQFDVINFFGKDGNIRNDIEYYKCTEKMQGEGR